MGRARALGAQVAVGLVVAAGPLTVFVAPVSAAVPCGAPGTQAVVRTCTPLDTPPPRTALRCVPARPAQARTCPVAQAPVRRSVVRPARVDAPPALPEAPAAALLPVVALVAAGLVLRRRTRQR